MNKFTQRLLTGFLIIAISIIFFGTTKEGRKVLSAVVPSLNSFTAGTSILSAEMNSNFTLLRTGVNEVNSAQILDATLAAADHASGYLVNSLVNANADINASKILLSGAVQLDEWTHASDGEKFDGADIYAGSVPLAALDTAITTFASYDSGWFAITNNAAYTKSHGLGGYPEIVQVYIAENNDGSGWATIARYHSSSSYGGSVVEISSTEIKLRTDSTGIHEFKDFAGNSQTPTSGYAKIICMKFN